MKLLLNWGKTTFSVTVSHGVHTFSLTHGAFSFLLVDVFPSAGKMKQTHRFDFWFFQHGAHQTGCSYLLGSPQKHFVLLSNIMAPSWLYVIFVFAVQVTDLRTTPGWDDTSWRSRHDVRWREPATAPRRWAAWRRRREQQIKKLTRCAANALVLSATHMNLHNECRVIASICRQHKKNINFVLFKMEEL